MPADDAITGAGTEQLGTLPLGTMPLGTLPDSAEQVGQRHGGAAPTIPGFEMLGELGRGGVGIVYKARQIALNRLVAIKMLSAHLQSQPEVLARFRTEAQSIASLQHANIVQVFEVGETAGRPFLALEFVPGGTLAQYLSRQPQQIRFAVEMTRTLALAVEHAHNQGILHRDLKPGNVLLNKGDANRTNPSATPDQDTTRIETAAAIAPKITDFGLAKQIHASDGPTEVGAVIGTPSYMAPEQASGVTRTFTAAVDVYALGAILYEMLTGRPPFLGESPTQTVLQVLSQEPVPPRELRPDCPRDLETIALKCLQKNPTRRYPSARDLAEDLRRFERGEPITARPAGLVERTIKWGKRRPTAAAALVAGMVLLVVSVLYAVEQRNHGVALQRLADREKTARSEAEENFILAHDLAEHERSAREQAQTNYQLARKAIKELLAEVGAKDLASVPNMDPVRRTLLKKALDSMQAVLEQDRTNALVKREVAQIEGDVGAVHEMLGDDAEAEKHYRNAVDLYREITDTDPSEPSLRHEQLLAVKQLGAFLNSVARRDEAMKFIDAGLVLAQVLVSKWPSVADYVDDRCSVWEVQGECFLELRKYAEAKQAYGQALKDLRLLVKEHADRREFRDHLAVALNNLGVVYRELDETRELAAVYGEAVQLLQELSKQNPSERSYHLRLGIMARNLGKCFWNNSDVPRAQEAFATSIAEMRGLVERYPGVLIYRYNLAQVLEDLGELLDYESREWAKDLSFFGALFAGRDMPGLDLFGMSLDRVDQIVVTRLFDEALLAKRKLLVERPDYAEYLGGLGFSYGYRAVYYRRRKDWAGAVDWEEKAIAQYRAAISIGKHPRYKAPLQFELREYANVLINLNRIADAARVAGELIQIAPDSGKTAFSAACVLAMCSESSQDDKAKTYADRAIELLRQAVKSGAVDGNDIKGEDALKALKSRSDFQELLHATKPSK